MRTRELTIFLSCGARRVDDYDKIEKLVIPFDAIEEKKKDKTAEFVPFAAPIRSEVDLEAACGRNV